MQTGGCEAGTEKRAVGVVGAVGAETEGSRPATMATPWLTGAGPWDTCGSVRRLKRMLRLSSRRSPSGL